MSRGFAAIGLFNPKYNTNVGGAVRAAMCFDAKLIAVEGCRYAREITDTPHAHKTIPLIQGKLHDLIPLDCVPVAVDLVEGARSLHSYTHPTRAFYVFGPEDSTLGRLHLDWCRDRIYVPCNGCLNLAATVNVVLYDRTKKLDREERILESTKRQGWRAA